MKKEELKRYCENELESYVYDDPQSTLGNPWRKEKVGFQLAQLKNSMVEPYLEKMELRDTYNQMSLEDPEYQDLWVVADDNEGYRVFYDPSG